MQILLPKCKWRARTKSGRIIYNGNEVRAAVWRRCGGNIRRLSEKEVLKLIRWGRTIDEGVRFNVESLSKDHHSAQVHLCISIRGGIQARLFIMIANFLAQCKLYTGGWGGIIQHTKRWHVVVKKSFVAPFNGTMSRLRNDWQTNHIIRLLAVTASRNG